MGVCSDKTSDEPLSIEAYAARYKGRTKIIRLLFIAKHLDQESCQIQALKMPYYEIKKGNNVLLFRDVVERCKDKLGSDYMLDLAWIEAVDSD